MKRPKPINHLFRAPDPKKDECFCGNREALHRRKDESLAEWQRRLGS